MLLPSDAARAFASVNKRKKLRAFKPTQTAHRGFVRRYHLSREHALDLVPRGVSVHRGKHPVDLPFIELTAGAAARRAGSGVTFTVGAGCRARTRSEKLASSLSSAGVVGGSIGLRDRARSAFGDGNLPVQREARSATVPLRRFLMQAVFGVPAPDALRRNFCRFIC
jgi:hypothetical protein